MDAITLIAIGSALCGWGAYGYMIRSRERYREAWKAKLAHADGESLAYGMAAKRAELAEFAAKAAGDEIRELRKTNDALATKCADLTKQLISTREALEESDKYNLEVTELSTALYSQIQEPRGEVL